MVQARLELLAGLADRAAGHHDGARAPGAGGVRRGARVAEHDPDMRRRYAQHFAGDLGQGGFHALSMRMHATAHLEHAVGRAPNNRRLTPRHHRYAPAMIDRGAMRALLAEHRHAEADAAAVRLATHLPRAYRGQVYRGHRAAYRFRVITAVEVLAGDVIEGHFVGAHQVAQPDLGRLQAGFDCNRVHHGFDGVADASSGHAAVRQDGRLVGRNRPGTATVALHLVGARQDAADLRGFQAGGKRVGRIGA